MASGQEENRRKSRKRKKRSRVATSDVQRLQTEIPLLPTLTLKKPCQLVLVLGRGVSATAFPKLPFLRSRQNFLTCLTEAAHNLKIIEDSAYTKILRSIQVPKHQLQPGQLITKILSSENRQCSKLSDCLCTVFENTGDQIHKNGIKLLENIFKLMLNGALLISLNYDKIIEEYAKKINLQLESIDWTQTQKVREWMSGENTKAIFHLLGVFDKPESVILDIEECDKLSNASFMQDLHRLYSQKSFCYLGIGLSTMDIIFDKLRAINPSNAHYYLASTGDIKDLRRVRMFFLENSTKLAFYGKNHSAFPRCMERLSSCMCDKEVNAPNNSINNNIKNSNFSEEGKKRKKNPKE